MGKYCTQCGSVLEQADQLFCKNCGKEVENTEKLSPVHEGGTIHRSTSAPVLRRKKIIFGGAGVLVLVAAIAGWQLVLKAETPSKIEWVLKNDHPNAERIAHQNYKIHEYQFANFKSIIEDNIEHRKLLIYDLEKLDNGQAKEIAQVVLFLNAENDYCVLRYNLAVAVLNFNARTSSRADGLAYKMDNLRKELRESELQLAKYHWVPVWGEAGK